RAVPAGARRALRVPDAGARGRRVAEPVLVRPHRAAARRLRGVELVPVPPPPLALPQRAHDRPPRAGPPLRAGRADPRRAPPRRSDRAARAVLARGDPEGPRGHVPDRHVRPARSGGGARAPVRGPVAGLATVCRCPSRCPSASWRSTPTARAAGTPGPAAGGPCCATAR